MLEIQLNSCCLCRKLQMVLKPVIITSYQHLYVQLVLSRTSCVAGRCCDSQASQQQRRYTRTWSCYSMSSVKQELTSSPWHEITSLCLTQKYKNSEKISKILKRISWRKIRGKVLPALNRGLLLIGARYCGKSGFYCTLQTLDKHIFPKCILAIYKVKRNIHKN